VGQFLGEVMLIMPRLSELSAAKHRMEEEGQADLAMMSVWLMICLINLVLLFSLY
jgi:hypothetical protein